MLEDKKHLDSFVRNVFDDNYAQAKDDLQSAVLEKLKGKMHTELQTQTATLSKESKK